jgi:membrane-bound serine protease (ClpP class)
LPAWGDLQFPLLKVLLSFTGSVVAMALLARWLPETRLFRRIELSATSPTPPAAGLPVGAAGVAETALRPAGKGRFDGQLVDVETEGDLIEKGAAIRIVTVAGSRVVVARA